MFLFIFKIDQAIMSPSFEVTVVIILLLPRYIRTDALSKCPNFEYGKGWKAQNPKTENTSHSDYLTIPAFLMSNYKSTQFRFNRIKLFFIPALFRQNLMSTIVDKTLTLKHVKSIFRLESEMGYFCDMNYEVIKINLIGLDTMSINLSTSSPTPPVHNTYKYTNEQVQSDFNGSVVGRFYGFSLKSRNSSYLEGFMYSVENITAIFDTNATEEEQMCDQDGKLSRNEVQFTPTGVLFYSGEYYRPNEYCIQSFDETMEWITVRKCNADCDNENTPCIPLCCHLHEHIDLSVSCCQGTLGSKPMFHPVIYDEINRRLSLEETIEPNGILETAAAYSNTSKVVNDGAAVVRPHYVTFKYHNACPDGWEPLSLFFNENGESDMNTRVHIKNNGKVAYIGDDRQWHFLDNYCVAGLVNTEGLQDEAQAMTMILYYCLNEQEVDEVMWPNYVLVGVFILGSIFLLFTVIVYVLLWEKQNIHGWTIMSFVTSEFFLFTFLSISYSLSLFATGDDISRTVYCTGSGILSHFFFLATFSWLTVINLDLWWTFKSLTPLSERSKGRKRFCLYMSFAWGLPITVVSVGLTLQSIYKENSSNVIVPDYGRRMCFLARQAKGVYLYYIVGTLLLLNGILISLTFYTIYKFKKSTRVASSSSSKSKEQSFKLFLKLVIVMGVTWIFEFVLWWQTDGHGFSWIFLVVDILNVLQAVATFMIFVCKRKIINQLEQKHPSLRVITRPLLKVIGARSNALMTSSSSKQTRSTTAGSSSVLGSRNKSQKQKPPTAADSKL